MKPATKRWRDARELNRRPTCSMRPSPQHDDPVRKVMPPPGRGDEDHGGAELAMQLGQLQPHLHRSSASRLDSGSRRTGRRQARGRWHGRSPPVAAGRRTIPWAIGAAESRAAGSPPPSPRAPAPLIGTPDMRSEKPMFSATSCAGRRRVGLKHHSDAALGRRHATHRLAVDQDLAAVSGSKPPDQPQQGGFAAAGRAGQHTNSPWAMSRSISCKISTGPKRYADPRSSTCDIGPPFLCGRRTTSAMILVTPSLS